MQLIFSYIKPQRKNEKRGIQVFRGLGRLLAIVMLILKHLAQYFGNNGLV